MAREWQQTRFKEYVLPDAVYYQSLWAVRDLGRMEERIRELSESRDSMEKSGSILRENVLSHGIRRSPTENAAVERAALEERVRGIQDAIAGIPDVYRSYVLSNIILKNPGNAFPNKLWRIWKQRFLYEVARNLSIL